MTIIELGRTTRIDARTTPIRPFIRSIVLGPFTPDADILAVSADLDETDRPTIVVTGVRDLQGAVYQRQASVADMDDLQQSFYWDGTAQTLYIHIPPSDNPYTTVYLYGLAQGFSQGRPVYIDDIEYQPLIQSAPAVRQQQDIENYGELSFITGAITLSNDDGRLDDLRTQPVYGNDVIIYHLDDSGKVSDNYEAAALTRIATLFVEDYDISLQDVNLRIQDRRKSQNASVPQERFSKTDYADIEDSVEGNVIPVLWGQAREIPAVVVNGEAETGNVKYRAALLLTALGTVQVDVDGVWTTRAATNVDLTTGYFELTAANGRKDGASDGQPLDAKLVGPTGIAITRLTDIIKDANERFTGSVYNDSNYNTEEWEAEETAIQTGSLYIDGEQELFELIEQVQAGANVGFRYEIAADGRRTIRIDDEARAVSKTIPNIVIQNRDEMNIETDSETLAAEVVVKHSQSHVDDSWLRVVDTGSLDDVLETYQQRPRKVYETLLRSAVHAAARAEYIRERFDTIRGIGEFRLMGRDLLSLRIYDIVNIEITPDESAPDAIKRRPFYGTWRCKILSVAPDAQTAVNTITAVLIEEL